MAYLGFTYVTDIAEGAANFNVNASYRDDVSQFEITNALIDQESVTLLNASAVWTSPGGQWLLGLYGKNLTDEDVRTAGYCFGNPATTGCPSALGLENNITVFYAAPRTFTGTIGFRF
jgi:iron complex outermembrane receptor protein